MIRLNGFSNDTIVIAQVPLAEYPDILNDRDPRIKWDTIAPQNSTVSIQPAAQHLYIPSSPASHPVSISK